jgi:uncharacterized membrane protein
MKQETKNYIIKLFWVFIIASIIGCLVETIVCIVQKGHFEIRQGVIYGPFIPVYGAGAVLFYLIVPMVTGATAENAKKISNMKILVYSMVLGGITEYIFSYGQECLFGTISWDYTNLLFNINGRTSLIHCIYWGIGGIIFIKFLYPYIENLTSKMNIKKLTLATTCLAIFMIYNISISMLAGQRQMERVQNISPKSRLDTYLDEKYPDKVMDTIFSNKKNVMSIE